MKVWCDIMKNRFILDEREKHLVKMWGWSSCYQMNQKYSFQSRRFKPNGILIGILIWMLRREKIILKTEIKVTTETKLYIHHKTKFNSEF